jgi:O-methyltransferase
MDVKPNPIHMWDDDTEFSGMFDAIVDHTLVDKVRCYILYQMAKHAASMPGEVAEIGVYKGGTARLLSQTFRKNRKKIRLAWWQNFLANFVKEMHRRKANGKTIHLFDTFSGMPTTDPVRDFHREGDFNDTSLEGVKGFLNGCDNIEFHPGFFPETAGPVDNLTFSFVHIDTDIYRSVLDCCEYFYPRMEQGGLMVFDDYGFISCPGAKMAVDEFFSKRPEGPCYLPTGQCLVVKQ